MPLEVSQSSTGSYTASLIGNIRSHLAGLQGFDVMALELIQNADDAKADKIIFDITDDGLLVRNSGQFTYCGDLHSPCAFFEQKQYKCDYHRITDVGSGGKLAKEENIGRFGIGFVSTYQVTDHPEIRSCGIKLTLLPEKAQWQVSPFEELYGTSFFLPWADDPNTEARAALGGAYISQEHINQLIEDFQKTLRKSLLFLRHVRKAEIRRNGNLLLGCDLDRKSDNELIVSFRPGGDIQQWYILRADASEAARELLPRYPNLKVLNRSTQVSIGLRVGLETLDEGVLYAFLPTEQATGLPVHINADFFPEADRKAVIFNGHQYQQAWNEMLIGVAAAEIAKDLTSLSVILGHECLWQLIDRAFKLFSNSSNNPACYKIFWEKICETGPNSDIAKAGDGSIQKPKDVFLPSNKYSEAEKSALLEAGVKLVADHLHPFRTAMNKLGAPILTLERLVNLLDSGTELIPQLGKKVERVKLSTFYIPLWSVLNSLLSDTYSNLPHAVNSLLKTLPVFVTEDLFVVNIQQTLIAPDTVDALRITELLPCLAIAFSEISSFSKIKRMFARLDLEGVASHISSLCVSDPVEKVLSTEKRDLKDLYSLFAELDSLEDDFECAYWSLKKQPIWLTNKGLVKATHALLSGDFTDPTGQADLFDDSVLTPDSRNFLKTRVGVEEQTIDAFVLSVVPTFFSESGPLDESKYGQLISELARHPILLNSDNLRDRLATLPLVPTQNGGWSCPQDTYYRDETLVKVLGDAKHLWVDSKRIPNLRSDCIFLENLGIRKEASPQHIVARMLSITENKPTAKARKASAEAFYALSDQYDRLTGSGEYQNALLELRDEACFPALGDDDEWYMPRDLYAPYRVEAFRTQVDILDFRNTQRLKTDLLAELGVKMTPETSIVVNHLRHCVNNNLNPHISTYQVLNERATQDIDDIESLRGERCIYIESKNMFVRTSQLYWVQQPLGKYAYTIPQSYRSYKSFYDAVGVKEVPVGNDLAEIIRDIVSEYYQQAKPLSGNEKAIYEHCLKGVALAYGEGELSEEEIDSLRESPSILNLDSYLSHPDELLLKDSEWHAGLFGEDLNQTLCNPFPETWPLLRKLGVARLSDKAKVSLDFVDGKRKEEDSIADSLQQRISIIKRYLHDKVSSVHERLSSAISKIQAESYEVVHIRASAEIEERLIEAPNIAVKAFFDAETDKLILTRPVDGKSWMHILNALFHQLMPEESGADISKLTIGIRQFMNMPLEDAHRDLTDAGVPELDDFPETESMDVLMSSNLDDIEDSQDHDDKEARKYDGQTDELYQSSLKNSEDVVGSKCSSATRHSSTAPKPSRPASDFSRTKKDGEVQNLNKSSNETQSNDVTREQSVRQKTPRAKHKQQWDRRLLSYVKQRDPDNESSGKVGDSNTHNLAIEAVSRDAVSRFEKDRGRVVEQMPQTHPGYDIISTNALTGEVRYIEVKGVYGEWNQTGVGLSRLQFSNAQNYGEQYWLYVVELVSDPDNMRIFPIQNPSAQVTSFMFDGNWRDVASKEAVDPVATFVPGARINHAAMGKGEIQNVVTRGSTKLLTILFDGKPLPTRNVVLNIHSMELEGADDGYNNS